jgi:hypothetical protein
MGLDRLLRFDADELCVDAMRATGRDDFGPETFREPLTLLCHGAEQEARLTIAGRLLTRIELARLLRNRLRIVDVRKRRPVIAAEPITAPIVITGTARSGTSILHELLAQDPANRTPAAWEVMYSVDPTDTERTAAHAEVSWWHDLAPEYLTMHENAGDLPHECIFLLAHAFASNHFAGALDAPTYLRWLATADLRPAYQFHRDLLQVLQARERRDRWVLKAPSHLANLPALFAVYPDARVVVTHRDPLKTLPSTINLMATLRHMRSDDVHVRALADGTALGVAARLEQMAAMRGDGRLPDAQFVDLHYDRLLADPLGAIGALYTRLDRTLTIDAATRMRRYLEAKPKGRHGAHRYGLDAFGLDPDTERARYRGYAERYGVTPER